MFLLIPRGRKNHKYYRNFNMLGKNYAENMFLINLHNLHLKIFIPSKQFSPKFYTLS